jgi:hypothetical protein
VWHIGRFLARAARGFAVDVPDGYNEAVDCTIPISGDPAVETESMGLVLTEAKIENLKDLWACEDGLRRPEDVRSVPVLVGQIPLEHLDLVIDMRSHTLTGNPAHGGEHMYEMY